MCMKYVLLSMGDEWTKMAMTNTSWSVASLQHFKCHVQGFHTVAALMAVTTNALCSLFGTDILYYIL